MHERPAYGETRIGKEIRDMRKRITELEAHGMCRCADEVRCDMRKLITDCQPYLKEGETPAECIQRNRNDTGGILKLLAKEKKRAEAAEKERDAYRKEALEWEAEARDRGDKLKRVRGLVDAEQRDLDVFGYVVDFYRDGGVGSYGRERFEAWLDELREALEGESDE